MPKNLEKLWLHSEGQKSGFPLYAKGGGLYHLLPMLHMLKSAQGSRKSRKRVGRGSSAGGGKTAGRGYKGQQARAGSTRRAWFEGGQKQILKRQPKLSGFRNPRRREFEVVNINVLSRKLRAGSYDIAALKAHGILRTGKPVKILGKGTVDKRFTLKVHAVSATAKSAVEKAGGSVDILRGE